MPRTRNWPYRRFASGILTIILISGLVGFPSAPAVAAPVVPLKAPVVHNRAYVATGWKWDAAAKVCLHVVATGRVSFTIGSHDSYVFDYQNRKIISPKVTVTTFNSCSAGQKAKAVTKLQVSQSVYSSTCQPGVGLGVGFPWNVGVSFTLECKTVNAATRRTTYGKGSTFTQSNTSTTISMADEAYGPVYSVRQWGGTHAVTYYPLQVAVQADLIVYRSATASDSVSMTVTDDISP